MQLTRFTDIGLRVVMALTADPDASHTSKQIAADLQLSYTHVAKVVSRLAELGVVHSRRGRSGGLGITELGRRAGVGWLARHLEGDAEVVDCEGPAPCPLRNACRLRRALATAQEAFYTSLDRLSVEDLIADPTGAQLLTLLPTLRSTDTPPTTTTVDAAAPDSIAAK
ncbi:MULTISPECIES: RrF2 family transcriptional regulator [Gordonia]|uniref:Nitric oxide-sensing transcriptional repressor NsrR n=2 Tax=Gordonia TaxID=2053 RepID=A0ABN3HAW6_9ACTN|nr:MULTISPECIES: Rrf2 family transcriptional regulator [Gordonia]AUH69163.1 transcriptional regulator [Gordonia sp. YC-JH1]KJR04990.1 transcriptional regulator [Gordonia sihwensis]KXT57880.1 transcriptional regulator [Gordonia sp. QH-12]MBY4569674.1 transcriptional regulator [Gordonia sihwensis]WFN94547.1 Rrf2 family transcriptional regulator [Gordonia sihwensis]